MRSDFGSGLAYSIDPASGRTGLTGYFRFGVTGAELILSGGEDLASMAGQPWHAELTSLADIFQREAGQPVRIEFVVRGHRLEVIAVTPAVLRGTALFIQIARRLDMGTVPDVLGLVTVEDLAIALAPASQAIGLEVICRGQGVAPGVIGGVAVFSADAAVAARERGENPVLFLPVTQPQDLPGLLASVAVVTERGGSTSHAAVVARGLGRVCVVALREARVDCDAPCLRPDGSEPVQPDDWVTVDGTAGAVYRGSVLATQATDSSHYAGTVRRAIDHVLASADRRGGLAVRVNADSPTEALIGRDAGAAGVGLCRVEHMLLGERTPLLASILTGASSAATSEALDGLRRILRDDFVALLQAMDGLPATVRLLDPPRHEFLPDLTKLEVSAMLARAEGAPLPDPMSLAAARRLHETNPMLGVRGIRLGVLNPRLLDAQLAALVEATAIVRREGGDPCPELLVPMVSLPDELSLVRDRLAETYKELGLPPADPIPVGAMIETPRAALLAADLARVADFISIGSNDLTALSWGLSRDDVERELMPRYRELGLIGESPTVRWDDQGVGKIVWRAITDARRVKPSIGVGLCGELALDPAAVRLLLQLGADYISCSPARLPVGRLVVGQVTVAMAATTGAR